MLLVMFGGALLAERRADGRALGLVPAGMVVFTLWLVFVIMPLVSPTQGLGPLLNHLPAAPGAKGAPGAQVIAFHLSRPSLVYYGGERVEHLDKAEQVRPLLESGQAVFVICRVDEAGPVLGPGVEVLAQEGHWELLENAAAARLS
jgi:hypothetical protein